MHFIGKILIGLGIVSVIAIVGFLDLEVEAGIIALTKDLALTTDQSEGFLVIGIAFGLVITVFSVDVILSLWKASKNKQKLTEAIT